MSAQAQEVMIRCSVEGVPTWIPAKGYQLDGGPFAVTMHNGRIGLTHIQTGYLVVNYLEKSDAEKLARELVKLPVDWGFDDPEAVKSFEYDVRTKIGELRQAACNGDLP
jgi:hypothetical protein